MEIPPTLAILSKKVFFLENLNAFLSLIVIIGSMFEYEFYYFPAFFKVDDENIYRVNEKGGDLYKGMVWRSVFSIICLITVFLSIKSYMLLFRLRKLQNIIGDGTNFFKL